jgi:hypothetical protein
MGASCEPAHIVRNDVPFSLPLAVCFVRVWLPWRSGAGLGASVPSRLPTLMTGFSIALVGGSAGLSGSSSGSLPVRGEYDGSSVRVEWRHTQQLVYVLRSWLATVHNFSRGWRQSRRPMQCRLEAEERTLEAIVDISAV